MKGSDKNVKKTVDNFINAAFGILKGKKQECGIDGNCEDDSEVSREKFEAAEKARLDRIEARRLLIIQRQEEYDDAKRKEAELIKFPKELYVRDAFSSGNNCKSHNENQIKELTFKIKQDEKAGYNYQPGVLTHIKVLNSFRELICEREEQINKLHMAELSGVLARNRKAGDKLPPVYVPYPNAADVIEFVAKYSKELIDHKVYTDANSAMIDKCIDIVEASQNFCNSVISTNEILNIRYEFCEKYYKERKLKINAEREEYQRLLDEKQDKMIYDFQRAYHVKTVNEKVAELKQKADNITVTYISLTAGDPIKNKFFDKMVDLFMKVPNPATIFAGAILKAGKKIYDTLTFAENELELIRKYMELELEKKIYCEGAAELNSKYNVFIDFCLDYE